MIRDLLQLPSVLAVTEKYYTIDCCALINRPRTIHKNVEDQQDNFHSRHLRACLASYIVV